MDIPRIIVAGVRSKVGKTLIAMGLMRCLADRGYIVQPFKVGPDFIDPGFHTFAARRASRNLDSFMLDRKAIYEVFARGCRGADIAVIEGKTGLYDSAELRGEKGSVAEVAKILRSPVVLVADVERMGRSLAAMLLGYKLFDREVAIEGVILNRAGGERHRERVVEAAKLAGMRVLGCVPRINVNMPYRHLGLVTAYEREDVEEVIERAAEVIERFVDVEAIVDVASRAPPLDLDFEDAESSSRDVRVGVVKDRAFSFYYTENLEELAKRAELVFVDSMEDKKLPDVDALYIGGGFPEVFAEQLERNERLRNQIYDFCSSGKPVYAECGGLMYLGESIEVNGCEYEMVGFLPLKTRMFEKFQAQGYCVYTAVRDTVVAARGEKLLGHEFHYSKPEIKGNVNFAFAVERGHGIDGKRDGVVLENTLACYLHLHFLSKRDAAERFVALAKKIREG
ncbi:MAG: cobyrinate a,c-diamide synthase [Archaeoglobaceae archaeon]